MNACFPTVNKEKANYKVALGVQKLLGSINMDISNRAIAAIRN